MKVLDQLALAKNASFKLGLLGGAEKNKILRAMANSVEYNESAILAANANDVAEAAKRGKNSQFLDRLTLNHDRIAGMVTGIRQVASLTNPVGVVLDSFKAPKSGLQIQKISVPFGVIGIIYEARPNVTADTCALAIKSGNAIVLRGSRDALRSNRAIVEAIKSAISTFPQISPDCVQLIEDDSRDGANKMMTANGYVDLLLPRGGAALIDSVIKNATVPVIQTGVGNCHVYVENTADQEMALSVIKNAKASRPSVCNAAESLLVDRSIASEFLPKLSKLMKELGVKVHACPESFPFIEGAVKAKEEDYYAEYLGLEISVKVISHYYDAVEHINKYGTHHSDAIITAKREAADYFKQAVDSSTVYVNASTRFTDGGEFGFGCELGISTQKLHARGPVGLKELTSYKYLVSGNGQVR